MAKDPAVLFYTSDFLTGTFSMTNEQVGKYIRLLCLQHQKGKLTEKDMLSICKAYDEDVYLKFRNEAGLFYNERMFNESERRKKYSESRKKNSQSSKNQLKTKKAYAKHMETATETITVDVNEFITDTWNSEKANFFNAYEWKEDFCRKKNITMHELEGKMIEFIDNIELGEEYKPLKELKSHFKNSYNKKLNGTHQQKPGTSEARIAALKKW
jgi:hypothetical protein